MSEVAATIAASKGPGFFRQRWHGQVALHQLFWWDLLAVGTLVNAGFVVFSLILLAQGMAGGYWLTLHALVLPYNLFLVAAVWRHPRAATLQRWLAMAWLGIFLLL